MTNQKNIDILIVGGGPAGLSTWLHLHKFNPDLAQKTILIEKETYPREKICGGALSSWGQNVLKFLDINLNIPFVSIQNTKYQYHHDCVNYKKKDFLKIIRRIDFDNKLATSAKNRGLNLHENEELIDIKRSNDKLKIKTNKKKYLVKTLIGADGRKSLVRTYMNPQVRIRLAPAIETVSVVNPQIDLEYSSQTAVLDFSEIDNNLQGYVWHFPCIIDGKPSMNHGICNININRQKPRPNINRIFKNVLEKRNLYISPRLWKAAPVPWNEQPPVLTDKNILLIGDAAGIEPFLGGGIHLSLSYGEWAANSIISAYSNCDFSFYEANIIFHESNTGKYIRKLTNLAVKVHHNELYVMDAIKKILLI